MANAKKKPAPVGEPRLEWVRLSQIKPALRNPKEHDIPAIVASLRRFGFIAPLVENAVSGLLVVGHGRLEATQFLFGKEPKKPPRFVRVAEDGEWMVPVLRGVAFDSEQAAEEYLVGANRWVEVGGWDNAALVPMLEQISQQSDDAALKAIGWSASAIENFLADFDATAGVRGKTPTELEAGYNAGAIKQIVVYFTGGDADKILQRLSDVMRSEKVDNNSAALERLLSRYENVKKLKPIRVAA